MLSRLSLFGNGAFSKCLMKYQPTLALTTSAPVAADAKPETPAESGQRDLVNFPRRVMNETSPPTRFGFIPDTWFKFFYPKTGVTGPYMFMFSVGMYLFSKEIIVMDHNTAQACSVIIAFYLLHYKYGDKVGAAYNKQIEKLAAICDATQIRRNEQINIQIKDLEEQKDIVDSVKEIMKAKKEMLMFQMEAAYRQRLTEAHKKVKSMLDCQAELLNIERRISQKNLMDYVIRNVMSSITPELEKNALQNCISNLNALSAKA